ncbi:MAG: AMP-dependent synthetase and ligase [Acidobacteriales bacterium]|nr:AMP-dependent synthetase and ligase [Terriglobales bacterium]
MRRSLVEHLEYFRAHAREVAYVQRRGYRRVEWTYARVLETACQFARELEARGIRKGDHVVLWGENCAEWVVAFLGCMMRGVVVVPMDRAGTAEFALRVAGQVRAKLVVASRSLFTTETQRHRENLLKERVPQQIFTTETQRRGGEQQGGRNGGETPPGQPAGRRRYKDHQQNLGEFASLVLEDLPEQLRSRERTPFSVELERKDMLQIIFTSGTTDEPRGVVISHGNVLANLEPFESEIKKYLKYERVFRLFNCGRGIRFMNLLPLSHVFGEFLGIFIPPLIGGCVVFHEGLNPAEVMSVIKREKVQVLVAVPRILESLKKVQFQVSSFEFQNQNPTVHPDQTEREAVGSEVEDSTLSLLDKGGAPLAENVWKRWWRYRDIHRQFGWKFWAFVSGGATLDAATEEFWRKVGLVVIQGYGLTETTSLISVNHPFHRGRGSIGKVLPGRDMKLSESGEILIRGENVATGYWQSGAVSSVSGDGEWFHTGDLGALDAEGYLHFKGRKKSVIVSAEGMNVYPEDLEAALRRQPGVRDAVVVGLSRNGNAEPCAVLIAAGDASEVVRRANETLAFHQQMRHWYTWPESDFPRTATQKPKTAVIAKVVEERLRGVRAQVSSSGSVAELVEKVSGRKVDGGGIDLSSIERVELQCALEERYQVDLDESEIAAVKTVEELERLVSPTLSLGDKGEAADSVVSANPTFRFAQSGAPGSGVSEVFDDSEDRKEPQPRAAVPHKRDQNNAVPQESSPKKYEYPSWAQRWPVTLIRAVVYYLLTWPATYLLASPRVIGRERLRDVRGPVLVVCNHVTYIDVGFVLAALPWRLRNKLAVAMEGERLWAMRYGGVVTRVAYFLVVALFNVFPLPKLSGFRESFAYAGESVGRGYSVLVFPEGLRTPTGEMQRFRSGIGLLASGLDVPVVPMRIDGLFAIRDKYFARPGAVAVRVGEAISVDKDKSPEEIAGELEEVVRRL